jgi:hypothetical protein
MELMPSLDQVEGGAHDAVSVDSVMSVDGVEVASDKAPARFSFPSP